jgi:hypothetical protein
MIDLDKLEELAKKATPGPWSANGPLAVNTSQDHPLCTLSSAFHRELENGKAGQDAEFISSANPTTILELIAEVRKLKSALEFYADQANYDVVNGSVHDFVPKGMNSPRKLWKVLDMGERARQALSSEETK